MHVVVRGQLREIVSLIHSNVFVLGIEFRSLGLAANPFSHQVILSPRRYILSVLRASSRGTLLHGKEEFYSTLSIHCWPLFLFSLPEG